MQYKPVRSIRSSNTQPGLPRQRAKSQITTLQVHLHTKTCYHILKSGVLLVADPNTPTDTYEAFSCFRIYLESSSTPPGSSGGSIRYAGEAADAPGGREEERQEEVGESDTAT